MIAEYSWWHPSLYNSLIGQTFYVVRMPTMLHLRRYLNRKLHVRDMQMSLAGSCVAKILTGGLYVADDITYKAPGCVLS
jgi:hypothetical protein